MTTALVRLGSITGLTESGNGTIGWNYIGNLSTSLGTSQYGLGDLSLAADGYYYATVGSFTTGDGFILGLDTTNSAQAFSTLNYGVYWDAAGNYRVVVSGTPSAATNTIAVVVGDLVRLSRAGTTITADRSQDAGGNWTNIHTFVATSSATLYTMLQATTRATAQVLTLFTPSSGPTVTSVTQTSGGTEGSPAVMTVALSGATSGSTNFAATLAGVTATGSGTDFTSDLASATYSNGVTFSGGNMVVPDAVSGWTVTIATTSDTLDEADETATLTVGGTAGTLTITDDDVQPTVTISDATEVAGTVTFVATLSAASGKTITFVADTADGTKTAGVDYTALTGSTVTFNPGETTKNIVVTAL